MRLETELIVKGILCLLAIPVVLRFSHASKRYSEKRAGQWLVLMAVIAAAAYVNFFAFHGRTSVHYWEQFHYFLGSKYFPELGYDGLYAASLQAQSESEPRRLLQPVTRDLRSNEVVPLAAMLDQREEVKARFSDARWRSFVADHQHFLDNMRDSYLYAVRKDHGYNPTPAWTFVARLFTSWLPARRETLVALGWLDPILLGLALLLVVRTYGSRLAASMVLVFGLGYAWRFDWIGGALLRLDWLAAVVVAACLLRRQRYRWAGALLAYAALMRLFPLAFLFGPGVLFLRALWRRENLAWAGKMAQGFALVSVLGIAAGAATGRGMAAWPEFREAIELHRGTWLTNNVGLQNVLLYDLETMNRELVDFSLPEPWIHWQEKMDALVEARRASILVATLVLLALLGVAAWSARLDEALVLGLGALYALFLLTSYYWAMLLLVPLRGGSRAAAALLALSAGLFGLHLVNPSFEMIYGVMSYALLGLLIAWIFPELRAAWRARAGASLSHGESGEGATSSLGSGCRGGRRGRRGRG